MPPGVRRRTRPRGSIDVLPSGALRVRLYAGQDPLTKKRHTLVKTIPAGPDAEKQAQAALDRMQREVAGNMAPRTNATVDQWRPPRWCATGPVTGGPRVGRPPRDLLEDLSQCFWKDLTR